MAGVNDTNYWSVDLGAMAEERLQLSLVGVNKTTLSGVNFNCVNMVNDTQCSL